MTTVTLKTKLHSVIIGMTIPILTNSRVKLPKSSLSVQTKKGLSYFHIYLFPLKYLIQVLAIIGCPAAAIMMSALRMMLSESRVCE